MTATPLRSTAIYGDAPDDDWTEEDDEYGYYDECADDADREMDGWDW